MSDEIIHGNMLRMTSPDMSHLIAAVIGRYNRLIETHLRMRGTSLIIPRNLTPDYNRITAMARRHTRGDYRSSEAEEKSLRAFAQWTLDINSDLRNQPRQTLSCLND